MRKQTARRNRKRGMRKNKTKKTQCVRSNKMGKNIRLGGEGPGQQGYNSEEVLVSEQDIMKAHNMVVQIHKIKKGLNSYDMGQVEQKEDEFLKQQPYIEKKTNKEFMGFYLTSDESYKPVKEYIVKNYLNKIGDCKGILGIGKDKINCKIRYKIYLTPSHKVGEFDVKLNDGTIEEGTIVLITPQDSTAIVSTNSAQ